LLIEFFARDISPESPKEDEIVFQKLAVFWIFVVLLTQQDTVPSAGFSEKVDKHRFPGGLGFG
jgi:hypothetical protein